MYWKMIPLVALVVVGFAQLAIADEVIGTISYTAPGFQTLIIDVYESHVNSNGWAHYTVNGMDVWASFSGGSWDNIPARDEGRCYCSISADCGKSRWDCGSRPCGGGTCSMTCNDHTYVSSCS